ncbi:MAG: methyltransferase family protein [Alphaproteobacteria bacterium]
MGRDADNAGVIALPPVLLLVSLLTGFLLDWLAPPGWLEQLPSGLRYGLGGFVSGAGLTISGLGAGMFALERTPVDPREPPTHMVTGGMFDYTRNPMYLAFYVVSLGIAILFAAEWIILTTIILALVIHYGVVLREERYLERRFGEEYLRYKERVPRYVGWF